VFIGAAFAVTCKGDNGVRTLREAAWSSLRNPKPTVAVVACVMKLPTDLVGLACWEASLAWATRVQVPGRKIDSTTDNCHRKTNSILIKLFGHVPTCCVIAARCAQVCIDVWGLQRSISWGFAANAPNADCERPQFPTWMAPNRP
jgi:hypothetical protein